MRKERLSKFQKWVLVKCLKEDKISNRPALSFFEGEKTRSQQAIISRSLKKLLEKGLLSRPNRWFVLTEQGFLKASEYTEDNNFSSFKDYQHHLEIKQQTEHKAFLKELEQLA